MFDIVRGIPEDKSSLGLITYALCADGIYLIRKSGCGHIVTKADGIAGYPKGGEEVAILPRKIPSQLFWEVIDFFNFVEDHHKGKKLEAYVLVMYNPSKDEFFLDVPLQKVGAASVAYDLKEVYSKYPGCKIIMDIHSHTSQMGAFWSATDNKDDNRDRYSGVIGKVDRIIPEHEFRFSTLGRHINVDMEDIWEENAEVFYLDMDEAIKKVVVSTPTTPGITMSRSFTHDWNGYGSNYGPSRSGYAGLWNKVKNNVMGDSDE